MNYTYAVYLHKNWSVMKKSWTNKWLVERPFIWYVNYERKTGLIYVYKNFETDFWSIPQWLWWFFNPTKYLAYILHDFFYSSKHSLEVQNYSRKEADEILKEALKVEWMGIFKRNLIYFAVRLFWKKFFRKS